MRCPKCGCNDCCGGDYEEEIVDMNLCEQKHLLLKPGRLYRFSVDENCEQCKVLAVLTQED